MENLTAMAEVTRGQLSKHRVVHQLHGKMLHSLTVVSAFHLLSEQYHLVVFSW